jgi:hypothetical protein
LPIAAAVPPIHIPSLYIGYCYPAKAEVVQQAILAPVDLPPEISSSLS